MENFAEWLGSWSVEISAEERSTLILSINGRRTLLPLAGAEMLGRALTERAKEASHLDGIGRPANDSGVRKKPGH